MAPAARKGRNTKKDKLTAADSVSTSPAISKAGTPTKTAVSAQKNMPEKSDEPAADFAIVEEEVVMKVESVAAPKRDRPLKNIVEHTPTPVKTKPAKATKNTKIGVKKNAPKKNEKTTTIQEQLPVAEPIKDDAHSELVETVAKTKSAARAKKAPAKRTAKKAAPKVSPKNSRRKNDSNSEDKIDENNADDIEEAPLSMESNEKKEPPKAKLAAKRKAVASTVSAVEVIADVEEGPPKTKRAAKSKTKSVPVVEAQESEKPLKSKRAAKPKPEAAASVETETLKQAAKPRANKRAVQSNGNEVEPTKPAKAKRTAVSPTVPVTNGKSEEPAPKAKRGASKSKRIVADTTEAAVVTADVEVSQPEELAVVAPQENGKPVVKGKGKRTAKLSVPVEKKLAVAAPTSEPSAVVDLVNPTMPFTIKITSWNVAGLRAVTKKGGFNYFADEKPDIFCLQEIKCLPAEAPPESNVNGYHKYWNAKPGGHAGVALYSRVMPHNIEYGLGQKDEHDGRVITAEYLKYFVVCVYVPNAGRKLVNLVERLKWDTVFQDHLLRLNQRKPVIVCGDMNVSHTEIDLANPKTNTKSAGFTPEERAGMTKMLSLGFVDTFRHLYPEKLQAYTYWTYLANARARNVGWRLDYFITSEKLKSKVVDQVFRTAVMGSDHCPITLFLNI